MLVQILIHTPLYVWAILAFLLWRGAIEMRDRELTLRRMLILPLVMLGLSLHDIALKFDPGVLLMAAWLAGCVAAALLAATSGRLRIAAENVPNRAPGRVLVRGSVMPLVLMLAIFFTKYVTSVVLVIQPHLAHQLPVAGAICLVFGLFNGLLLGRLARLVYQRQTQRPELPAVA